MKDVVLFGNRAISRTTYHDLVLYSQREVAGFCVDRDYLDEETLFGLPVVPFDEVELVFPADQYDMLIAVGYVAMNALRAERYVQAKDKGYELINFISPHAVMYPGVVTGDNCQISHNCTIFPDVRLGDDVTIGANSVVGHDVVVGDHCFISCGATICGSVTIGPRCFLGANATIRNHVQVAEESVVGAGALVLEDTERCSVHMGQAGDVLPISSRDLSIR